MTTEPRFALHPLAAQDITEIWEYIAADDPLAAQKVREEIQATIWALTSLPYQGLRRPDLTSQPLRFALVRDYLIAYAPEEKPLVGCRCHTRETQSARYGGHSEGKGVDSSLCHIA
jgi:plasmid stabilization system protein ParE